MWIQKRIKAMVAVRTQKLYLLMCSSVFKSMKHPSIIGGLAGEQHLPGNGIDSISICLYME